MLGRALERGLGQAPRASFGGSRPPVPAQKVVLRPPTPPEGGVAPRTPSSQKGSSGGGGGVGPLYLFRLYGALLHESLWAFGQAKKRVFW